jgi:hypothetical protein
MSHVFLQVKLATLAEEAKIIRRKEQNYRKWFVTTIPMTKAERQAYKEKRWNEVAKARKEKEANRRYDPELRQRLYRHRIDVVRPEARAAHLALAYLKGREYKTVEHKFHRPPSFHKVWHNIIRFGNIEKTAEESLKFAKWFNAQNPEYWSKVLIV